MIHARIAKRFAQRPESAGFALDVEFRAAAGVTVLFGSSGAGKTLTLECIAGFVRPDAGRIMLDDAILFDAASGVHTEPRRRNCGYVFQNYALFPHMTLRDNLLFAADRLPRLGRHRRVTEMLERFRLIDVAGRKPHEVSGGQQQRCSIARALIGGPRALLLDEPARGLDAPLRADLYAVLRQVRAEFELPILLVTHDLDECFELGEEMLVLREGRVAQTGVPRKIYEQPASVDIARLLGIENVLPAEIAALDPGRNTSILRLSYGDLRGPYFPGHLIGDRVHLCVRAGQLRVLPSDTPPRENQLPAKLARVSEQPGGFRLEFEGGMVVSAPRDAYLEKDNRDLVVEFPSSVLRVI